ncbi:MAG: N-formylglutamate amidohydrolase [Nocardiaceae bacterium]|nr:N-formylglutamate amidohydrolase [Nocardiaceae bacterium]
MDSAEALRAPFSFYGDPAPHVMATAIHAGHDLRPELLSRVKLADATRRREEDPFTDRIAACTEFRAVANRSRFEVDLNRDRDAAVYCTPDDCWGLDLWRDELPQDVIARSLEIYDEFYADLAEWLDPMAAAGPFVVFDVHAYNFRPFDYPRHADPNALSASEEDNPDINVGTGSVNKERWAGVVTALLEAMNGLDIHGAPLDVRENVRFTGRRLAAWVHERYPTTGCALSLEFKKTFMDERTGSVDDDHLDELTAALKSSIPAVVDAANRAVR